MSHSYRDLLVWQKSMGLVKLVYQETRSFPHEEMFGLTSQMRRAAVSVPCNVAEGQGRASKKEFRANPITDATRLQAMEVCHDESRLDGQAFKGYQ